MERVSFNIDRSGRGSKYDMSKTHRYLILFTYLHIDLPLDAVLSLQLFASLA